MTTLQSWLQMGNIRRRSADQEYAFSNRTQLWFLKWFQFRKASYFVWCWLQFQWRKCPCTNKNWLSVCTKLPSAKGNKYIYINKLHQQRLNLICFVWCMCVSVSICVSLCVVDFCVFKLSHSQRQVWAAPAPPCTWEPSITSQLMVHHWPACHCHSDKATLTEQPGEWLLCPEKGSSTHNWNCAHTELEAN